MYGIRYEPRYTAQSAEILGTVRRADEALEGLEHLLARDPRLFKRVSDVSTLWAAEGVVGDDPAHFIRVYYVIEEEHVVLRWIEEVL